MKNRTKRLVVSGYVVGMSFALINALGMRVSDAKSVGRTTAAYDRIGITNTPAAAAVQAPAQVSAPVASPAVKANTQNAGELDTRRQLALGMIETGNNDFEIGGAGEVSRYQIMPSVWKHYSRSSRYQNPVVSLAVAQRHWTDLYDRFKRQAHREPTDFDMYVLWNTRYGYYASRGFNPARLSPTVRNRAQRFVNLVQREEL